VKNKARKPFQFGLATLLWVTAGICLALGLGWAYWVHIGHVAVQILVAVAAISVVGALLVLPMFAVTMLQKAFELGQLLLDAWQEHRAARRAEAEDEEDDEE
jgi:hypothetical protein